MSPTITGRLVLPVLSLLGLAIAGAVVAAAGRAPVVAAPLDEPARSRFVSSVAGAGLVEPSTEFIEIGVDVEGIVAELFVEAGATVRKGDRLLRIDDRSARAALVVATAELALAEAELSRRRSAPRAEELPIAEARVIGAEAELRNARNLLELVERVGDEAATSRDERVRRQFLVDGRSAALAEANAQLELLRAGSWGQDIAVAEATVAAARARLEAAVVEVDRHEVRAPVDATVLRVDVRPGEHAAPGGRPAMTIGDTSIMLVRVDVDENDAWRVRAGAAATASLRGNSAVGTELEFVRLEPFVVPKRSLTGLSSERVDTRVLQVVYRFAAAAMPAYPGQQVDVFIDAPARSGRSSD